MFPSNKFVKWKHFRNCCLQSDYFALNLSTHSQNFYCSTFLKYFPTIIFSPCFILGVNFQWRSPICVGGYNKLERFLLSIRKNASETISYFCSLKDLSLFATNPFSLLQPTYLTTPLYFSSLSLFQPSGFAWKLWVNDHRIFLPCFLCCFKVLGYNDYRHMPSSSSIILSSPFNVCVFFTKSVLHFIPFWSPFRK